MKTYVKHDMIIKNNSNAFDMNRLFKRLDELREFYYKNKMENKETEKNERKNNYENKKINMKAGES